MKFILTEHQHLTNKLRMQSCISYLTAIVNPLSANPTKWSNTLKQFVGIVGLALKGLKCGQYFLFIFRYVLMFLRNVTSRQLHVQN